MLFVPYSMLRDNLTLIMYANFDKIVNDHIVIESSAKTIDLLCKVDLMVYAYYLLLLWEN